MHYGVIKCVKDIPPSQCFRLNVGQSSTDNLSEHQPQPRNIASHLPRKVLSSSLTLQVGGNSALLCICPCSGYMKPIYNSSLTSIPVISVKQRFSISLSIIWPDFVRPLSRHHAYASDNNVSLRGIEYLAKSMIRLAT
jgi:hypothetical protein